jgi:signal peptidase I
MVIPRKGDTWEYKLPNKPKKVKVIDYIYKEQFGNKWHFCVKWFRWPRGRYSALAVRTLLKYGRLISRTR